MVFRSNIKRSTLLIVVAVILSSVVLTAWPTGWR